MEEDFVEESGTRTGSVLVTGLMCVILSALPVGNVFCVLPLLIGSSTLKKKSDIVRLFGICTVCITALSLYGCWYKGEAFPVGLFCFTIYLPLAGVLAGAVYCLSGRRFIPAALAQVLISGVLAVWINFGGSAVDDLFSAFMSTATSIFGESMQEYMAYSLSIVSVLTLYMLVPLAICVNLITVTWAESVIHRFDEVWQERVGTLKIRESFVWVFIVSWFGILGLRFVPNQPLLASVLFWNVALCMSVMYIAQGFSVLVFRLRRHNPAARVQRILLLTVAVSILTSLVPVAALCIVGVLDNWFDLRKPIKKEKEYEDYS